MNKVVNIVIGAQLIPYSLDDPKKKHNYALMIQDEEHDYNVVIGLDRDDSKSQDYIPYWHRTMTMQNLKNFRDALSDLIYQIEKKGNKP